MAIKTLIIKKPLYSTFCYIRDVHLRGKNLRVVLPQGEAVIDCKEWIRTGKKMEKVFKIAGKPMVLWGNYVRIPGLEAVKTAEGKVEEKVVQPKLL